MCQIPKLTILMVIEEISFGMCWPGRVCCLTPARGEEELAQGLELLEIQCSKCALNKFFISLTHFLSVLPPMLVPPLTAVPPPLGLCRKGEGGNPPSDIPHTHRGTGCMQPVAAQLF